jgi:hypothetical protein
MQHAEARKLQTTKPDVKPLPDPRLINASKHTSKRASKHANKHASKYASTPVHGRPGKAGKAASEVKPARSSHLVFSLASQLASKFASGN